MYTMLFWGVLSEKKWPEKITFWMQTPSCHSRKETVALGCGSDSALPTAEPADKTVGGSLVGGLPAYLRSKQAVWVSLIGEGRKRTVSLKGWGQWYV